MNDDDRHVLRQIRRRLTVIAVATSTIAIVFLLPYAIVLVTTLAPTTSGTWMAIVLFGLLAFGAVAITMILRNTPRDGTAERRGFEPTFRNAPPG